MPGASPVHRRGDRGARADDQPRRRRVRGRRLRLDRSGGQVDPLRADVLRRSRHRAGDADPRRRGDPRPRRDRLPRRARRSGARAAGHGQRRPHARDPRRADELRAAPRRLRLRGGPERRAPAPGVRRRHLRQALRRRRDLRLAAPGHRGRGDGAPRPRGRGRLDPDHPPRPACRAALRDRAGRRRAGAVRDRGPQPAAHRGPRGRGAVRQGPEGLVGDAAQAQPDHRPSGSPGSPGSCAAMPRPGSRTWRSGTSGTSRTRAPSG